MVKVKSTGIYTALMSWIAMLCAGWYLTPHPQNVLHDVLLFLTGYGSYGASETTGLLAILPCVFLIVAIDFPITLASGIGATMACGRSVSNAIQDRYKRVTEGPYFRGLFVAVFVEELIFRWFLLGQCANMFKLQGPNGFYLLLIFSNVLFAYVHLGNYRDSSERQWPRVLPQFFSGLFFSYVFVRYGLVASVLTHFAANSIIFSIHKLQNTNKVDLTRMVVYAVYAFVAYHNMNKPLTDALQWFSIEPTFVLQNWTMNDYVALSFFVSSCLNLGADLLLFDKNLPKNKKTTSFFNVLLVSPVIICFFLGIFYGTYWLVSQCIHDFVLSILISAIVYVSVINRNPSLSAAQRSFWVGVPSAFVTICIIHALGFKGAFIYMAVSIVLSIPQIILTQYDD